MVNPTVNGFTVDQITRDLVVNTSLTTLETFTIDWFLVPTNACAAQDISG